MDTYNTSLASIHNDSQNEEARNLCGLSSSGYCFIGLSDESVEGQWVWSDGSEYNYSNWGGGGPDNNNGNEDCAVINAGGGWWGDIICTNLNWDFYFLCNNDDPTGLLKNTIYCI